MLLAPGKGLEPLRARSPPAILPLLDLASHFFRSRGWRDNHSATPAPANKIVFQAKRVFIQFLTQD